MFDLNNEMDPPADTATPEAEPQPDATGANGDRISDPAVSPFKEEETTSPLSPDLEAFLAGSRPAGATPMRTMTAGLAMMSDTPTGGPEDVVKVMRQNIAMASAALDQGKEYQLQLESASRQILSQDRALRDLPNYANPVTPDITQAVATATMANRQRQLADEAMQAQEEEAIKNAISLYNAGDEVGYRMAVNAMQPDKAGTFGVQMDDMKKGLILANAIERAQLDQDKEGLFHSLLGDIISIPNTILLQGMFEQLGNVADGTNGYSQSFWRFLAPSSDMGKQILAVQGMNSTDLAKYLPTLLDSIKGNSSTLGYFDPGTNLRLLSEFRDGLTSEEIAKGNIGNAVDIATIFPFGKAGKFAMTGTDFLVGMGARKAAAARITEAIDGLATDGAEAVFKASGMKPEEVISNSLPSAINPLVVPAPKISTKATLLSGAASRIGESAIPKVNIGLSSDVSETLNAARIVLNGDPAFPQLQALRAMTDSVRTFSKEEMDNAIEGTIKDVEKQTSESIADFEVVSNKLENGSATTSLRVVINKPFATEAEARGWLVENGRPATEDDVLFDAEGKVPVKGGQEIVQDASGAFFPRMVVDIPEASFWTSTLNPPAQSSVGRLLRGRFWKNASQLTDEKLFGMQVEAGQHRQKLLKLVDKELLSPFRKMPRGDRAYLTQVLMKGDNLGKWFNDSEFRTIWERATGKPASDEVQSAYRQYKVNNDIEWRMRNADLYASKAVRGFESVRFNAMGFEIDRDGRVATELGKPDSKWVYNASDNIHYNDKLNPLSEKRLKEYERNGYVLTKLEKAERLPDGSTYDTFLVKKSEIERAPLRREQLPYRAGGHRLYKDKYFVKQPSIGTQTVTGEKFLLNPNVFITAPTIKEATEWADTMNKATQALREGKTAKWLDENLFKGQERRFPKGEELIDGIKDGTFNPDYAFEPLFDREMPALYRGDSNFAAKFVDDDSETVFSNFYHTTGRMYYSPKGTQLKSFSGDLAPTLDPFETQSRALYNVSSMSSFSDFKMSSIDRWVKTYSSQLEGHGASNIDTFLNAQPARGTPSSLVDTLEAQRESIKRVLGFRTQFDRDYSDWLRTASEWAAGGEGPLASTAAKLPLWYMDKNPLNFLRGLASDMKLGFFNIGQLPIQISTAFSAMALSPRAGMKALPAGYSTMAYFLAKRLGTHENVLDSLAKGAMRKLAGFETEEEFKSYVRAAADSGFFDLGETHSMVNAAGPASTFSIMNKQHSFREMAKWAFYQGEAINRQVAFRIAYEEAVEKFGKRAAWDDAQFRQYLKGRAENYSFNMSNESKSYWQQGLLSIPTQFFAYNMRMIEALTGKNFTRAQRLRLLAMQFGMAGTGGVPIVAAVSDYINTRNGSAPNIQSVDPYEKLAATTERGLFDLAVSEITGADVQIGKKFGTGDWSASLIRDIFGYSSYGPKTVAEMAGGSTAAILGPVLSAPFRMAGVWSAYESGGEEVDLTGDEWLRLGRQFSSFNNWFKSSLVRQYGIYQSASGSTQITNLPKQDSMFVALGFEPGETKDMEAWGSYKIRRDESVKEAATFINNKLVDSLNRPDNFESNAREVNAFINLIPPDLRLDVLRRVQSTRDPSVYDRMLRQRDRQDLLDSFSAPEEDQQTTPTPTNEESAPNGQPN